MPHQAYESSCSSYKKIPKQNQKPHQTNKQKAELTRCPVIPSTTTILRRRHIPLKMETNIHFCKAPDKQQWGHLQHGKTLSWRICKTPPQIMLGLGRKKSTIKFSCKNFKGHWHLQNTFSRGFGSISEIPTKTPYMPVKGSGKNSWIQQPAPHEMATSIFMLGISLKRSLRNESILVSFNLVS